MNSFYKNKKVLITGGCGFIGSHIAKLLVAAKAEVTIIDNLSTGSIENIASIYDKVTLITASIENLQNCVHASKDQEFIFHLAAFISVPQSFIEPQLCHAINVTGTLHILEAARLNKVSNLVFSSSAAVYGPSTKICNENDPGAPQSPYGYTKMIGELYCQQYANLFKINTVIARYFNVYGAGQNSNGSYAAAVAKFTQCMRTNAPITIYGDGMQTRDFISVDTVAQANLLLGIQAQNYAGQIFNIGSGTSITLLELIDRLKIEFPNYRLPIQFEPSRTGDVKFSAADCSKYQNIIKKQKGPENSEPF